MEKHTTDAEDNPEEPSQTFDEGNPKPSASEQTNSATFSFPFVFLPITSAACAYVLMSCHVMSVIVYIQSVLMKELGLVPCFFITCFVLDTLATSHRSVISQPQRDEEDHDISVQKHPHGKIPTPVQVTEKTEVISGRVVLCSDIDLPTEIQKDPESFKQASDTHNIQKTADSFYDDDNEDHACDIRTPKYDCQEDRRLWENAPSGKYDGKNIAEDIGLLIREDLIFSEQATWKSQTESIHSDQAFNVLLVFMTTCLVLNNFAKLEEHAQPEDAYSSPNNCQNTSNAMSATGKPETDLTNDDRMEMKTNESSSISNADHVTIHKTPNPADDEVSKSTGASDSKADVESIGKAGHDKAESSDDSFGKCLEGLDGPRGENLHGAECHSACEATDGNDDPNSGEYRNPNDGQSSQGDGHGSGRDSGGDGGGHEGDSGGASGGAGSSSHGGGAGGGENNGDGGDDKKKHNKDKRVSETDERDGETEGEKEEREDERERTEVETEETDEKEAEIEEADVKNEGAGDEKEGVGDERERAEAGREGAGDEIEGVGDEKGEEDEREGVGDERERAEVEREGAGDEIEGAGDEIAGAGAEREGAGDEIEGAGDEREAAGDEIEGAGDEIEGAGDEIEGAGDEIEGAGDEIEGAGDETEGAGVEIEGAGDETEGAGGEIEGAGDETEGAGDEIEGAGDETEGAGVEIEGAEDDAEGVGHVREGEREGVGDEIGRAEDDKGELEAEIAGAEAERKGAENEREEDKVEQTQDDKRENETEETGATTETSQTEDEEGQTDRPDPDRLKPSMQCEEDLVTVAGQTAASSPEEAVPPLALPRAPGQLRPKSNVHLVEQDLQELQDLEDSVRDAVTALEEENRRLRSWLLCKKCNQLPFQLILDPCGHLVCGNCRARMGRICDINLCHKEIRNAHQVLLHP